MNSVMLAPPFKSLLPGVGAAGAETVSGACVVRDKSRAPWINRNLTVRRFGR
jgi:hypothetical protein